MSATTGLRPVQLAGGANSRGLNRIAWWAFFVVCSFYGIYALYTGILEIASLAGLPAAAPDRASPVVFVLHALTGGSALITGVLQFNRSLLRRHRAVHRALGRMYVAAIWLASMAGLWSAVLFDEGVAGKIALGAVGVLWFGVTTIAYVRIRQRNVRLHREWMIRSYALSLFFVTFSLWVPALTGTSLPHEVSYPLAVFLSWSVNLLVAEVWIRRTRNRVVTIPANGTTVARKPVEYVSTIG